MPQSPQSNRPRNKSKNEFKKAERVLRKLAQETPENSLIKLEKKNGRKHSYYALKTDENEYIYLKDEKTFGRGIEGRVFKATTKNHEFYSAVKVINRDINSEYNPILKDLNRLISDGGHKLSDESKQTYFFLSPIKGVELLDLLKGDDLSYRVKLKIALKAAEELSGLHKKNIVHRDIKPQNYIVNIEHHKVNYNLINVKVKLIDFGCARYVNENNEEHFIEGTPAYMPPEYHGEFMFQQHKCIQEEIKDRDKNKSQLKQLNTLDNDYKNLDLHQMFKCQYTEKMEQLSKRISDSTHNIKNSQKQMYKKLQETLPINTCADIYSFGIMLKYNFNLNLNVLGLENLLAINPHERPNIQYVIDRLTNRYLSLRKIRKNNNKAELPDSLHLEDCYLGENDADFNSDDSNSFFDNSSLVGKTLESIDGIKYRICKEIGSGNSGATVYLVQNLETFGIEALKGVLATNPTDLTFTEKLNDEYKNYKACFSEEYEIREFNLSKSKSTSDDSSFGFEGLNFGAKENIPFGFNDKIFVGFTMPLVQGVSLKQFKKASQNISLDNIITLTESLLEELKSIHDNNIIHCDLNLENIFWSAHSKKITIIDFGESIDFNKEINVRRGSPAYTAPEIKEMCPRLMSYSKTALPYGPKTDIYAIGIVLDEMSNCLVNKEGGRYKDFKTLISAMLERNPEDRITPNEAFAVLKNISCKNNEKIKNVTLSNNSFFKPERGVCPEFYVTSQPVIVV